MTMKKAVSFLVFMQLSLTANAFTVCRIAPAAPTSLSATEGFSIFEYANAGSASAAKFDIEPYLEKAAREDALFKTDPSAFFWRYLKPQDEREGRKLLADFFTSVMLTANPTQRAVWTTFFVRTAFFGANAAAANVLANRKSASIMVGDLDLSFQLYEMVKCYEQELKYIEDGSIKYPWDFIVQKPTRFQPVRIQWKHKQTNPLFALQESMRLLVEAPAIMERLAKYNGKPAGTVPVQRKGASLYPKYYLNDFHYQTDGWLSAESAKRYEVSTETIMFGTQDTMQRQTLLPLMSKYRGNSFTQSASAEANGPSSILEVACGTGRFSTFVRDNFPASSVTLTDLSPFYLEKSMENDRYWRDFRGREAMLESTGDPSMPAPAQVIQTNAETLPFLDNTFDAVLCVYLFHEIPGPARKNVAREMARVVKPGGIVVLSDSIQTGDRKMYGNSLDAFSKLNEPHYIGYQRADLPALFTSCGLECHEKYVNLRTKTLSFVKPKHETKVVLGEQ
ncbi:hypothetical protein MPSEU_000845300 [Mayamaea pseudoterrestris]|nr:hypothetical protein MPSEU_000845300 [Mayamaea pseudoterrestris]